MVTLTALAALEAVTALPAAAVQLGQARVSASRIATVLDAPDPVRDPPVPRPVPAGPLLTHEIKHDGLPLRMRAKAATGCAFSRRGHN